VARTFGTAEMAAGLGATLGPLIGGYLYDHVSHQSPFIFNGVLMLFAAGVASVILRNSSDAKTGQTADLD
jgi:MFS family permease